MSFIAYDVIKQKIVEQKKMAAALQEAKELMEETAPSTNKNKKENKNGRNKTNRTKSTNSSR